MSRFPQAACQAKLAQKDENIQRLYADLSKMNDMFLKLQQDMTKTRREQQDTVASLEEAREEARESATADATHSRSAELQVQAAEARAEIAATTIRNLENQLRSTTMVAERDRIELVELRAQVDAVTRGVRRDDSMEVKQLRAQLSTTKSELMDTRRKMTQFQVRLYSRSSNLLLESRLSMHAR